MEGIIIYDIDRLEKMAELVGVAVVRWNSYLFT